MKILLEATTEEVEGADGKIAYAPVVIIERSDLNRLVHTAPGLFEDERNAKLAAEDALKACFKTTNWWADGGISDWGVTQEARTVA